MRSQPSFRFSYSPVPGIPREDTGIVPSVPSSIPASLRSRGHVGLSSNAAGRAAWLRKTAAGHTEVGGRDGPPVAIRVLRRRHFLPISSETWEQHQVNICSIFVLNHQESEKPLRSLLDACHCPSTNGSSHIKAGE